MAPRRERRRSVGRVGLAIALVLAAAAGLWAVNRPSRTAEQVRAKLHSDLRFGRLSECEDALKWLARHARPTTEDTMIEARVLQLRGRDDASLGLLAKVADSDPLAPQARLMAGLIELGHDRLKRAEVAFLAGLATDPGQKDARLELIRLYAKQQRLDDLNAQCRALVHRNLLDGPHLRFWCLTRNTAWNPADDLPALGRAIAADPDDRASRLALADALRRLGHAGEAERALAPLSNENPEARALRAFVALDRGDLERADALLAEGPDRHAGLSRLRGQLALVRRDGATADRQFAVACALEPDDRQGLFGRATALRILGREADAQPYLAAVRRLDALSSLVGKLASPEVMTDAGFLRQLADSCESVGRRVEARAWNQRVIGLRPLDPEAQQALFRLGNPPADVSPLAAAGSDPR